MQRFPYFLAVYNMLKNKRSMVIKTKKYKGGNSIGLLCIFSYPFSINGALDLFYIDCICYQKCALYTKYDFLYFIFRLFMAIHH